jgi:hypothetical protein
MSHHSAVARCMSARLLVDGNFGSQRVGRTGEIAVYNYNNVAGNVPKGKPDYPPFVSNRLTQHQPTGRLGNYSR